MRTAEALALQIEILLLASRHQLDHAFLSQFFTGEVADALRSGLARRRDTPQDEVMTLERGIRGVWRSGDGSSGRSPVAAQSSITTVTLEFRESRTYIKRSETIRTSGTYLSGASYVPVAMVRGSGVVATEGAYFATSGCELLTISTGGYAVLFDVTVSSVELVMTQGGKKTFYWRSAASRPTESP
jgi:hypothetical protein